MNAVSVRRRRKHFAVGRRLHVAHQHGACLQQLGNLVEIPLLRKLQQSLEQIRFSKQRRAIELRDDAKQFQPMLIADADRDRHRHDAAQDGRPERDDETLIRFAENNQLVAGLHAASLQRAEQRECAVPQLGETDDALIVFTVDEANLLDRLSRASASRSVRVS